MTKHFFVHTRDMWQDSWTYGDWRQYLCKRGETTQCAKFSAIPFAITTIASCWLIMMAVLLTFYPHDVLNMTNIIATMSLAGFIVIANFLLYVTDYNLMVAVGPLNRPDGYRVLPGDK
ncbi:MAG: hypothetical protein ACTHJR_12310 [Sphingomonas sp.]